MSLFSKPESPDWWATEPEWLGHLRKIVVEDMNRLVAERDMAQRDFRTLDEQAWDLKREITKLRLERNQARDSVNATWRQLDHDVFADWQDD